MATVAPVYAASFDSMESRKRKLNRVPLPYLIRPFKRQPVYDTYALYNDFIAYSSLEDESDDEEPSVKAVRTSLENASLSDTVSAGSLTDEEYVVVDNVEVSPNPKTERAGAIQMMELSKSVHEMKLDDAGSDNEDAGSDSDAWVVL
ncbi:hypothetical protein BRARA_A00970 [Brassica rapa]|uniref:Uncharacterized protein n=2 Tax=Brassica TaxID=3705 RepID=A0ABQ8EHZ3_BRANA|nr:uncharacterized protein LOC106425455 [Brassica napus]KAH0941309.1 hypothetical protein HID58_000946 [Brassica napus]RID78116.1 hypothetical protein BRARA_A00970 [Brassica rapa]